MRCYSCTFQLGAGALELGAVVCRREHTFSWPAVMTGFESRASSCRHSRPRSKGMSLSRAILLWLANSRLRFGGAPAAGRTAEAASACHSHLGNKEQPERIHYLSMYAIQQAQAKLVGKGYQVCPGSFSQVTTTVIRFRQGPKPPSVSINNQKYA